MDFKTIQMYCKIIHFSILEPVMYSVTALSLQWSMAAVNGTPTEILYQMLKACKSKSSLANRK